MKKITSYRASLFFSMPLVTTSSLMSSLVVTDGGFVSIQVQTLNIGFVIIKLIVYAPARRLV